MRLVGNHIYPTFIDEASRTSPEAANRFINLLNSSYGARMRHHGYDGKFLLSGPVVMVGQDAPDNDAALLTKVIIVDISDAQGELREFPHRFPVVEFGEWLIARLTPKIALDRVSENVNTLFPGEKLGRFANNYGALMIAIQELAEFSGLTERLDDWIYSVKMLARFHLQDTAMSRRESVEILNTLSRQVILDPKGSPPYRIDGQSLIIHKSSILHYLKAKGYTFAVTSTKRFIDHLRRDGFLIADDVSRSIGGIGYSHCLELSLSAMDKAGIDWPIT